MELIEKIEELHKIYKAMLYKNIRTYTMIALANKITSDKKIKDRIHELINQELIKDNPNHQLISYYTHAIKTTKTDWKTLESVLKLTYAYKKNKEFQAKFLKEVATIDLFKSYITDEKFLVKKNEMNIMIDELLTYCKRNFNRYQQVKNRRDEENRKYRAKNRIRAIKTRTQINQEFNAKKHADSKNLVLEYALKILANNQKLTIKNVKNEIEKNNEKLGNTQISIYLNELKDERLINE